MDNREVLEQQLKDLEVQKATLFESGGADQVQVGRLNEQIKVVRHHLGTIANEDIAESYQASDKPYIISVSGQQINLRDYMQKEEHYQFIAIALSQSDNEKQTAWRDATRELTDLFEIERQQFRDQLTNADTAADARYNELVEQTREQIKSTDAVHEAKYNELYEQFHIIKNERDDFERKHQAAASEVDSLKQQLEVISKKVVEPVATNLNGNLAEAMRKAQEAKRAIYNVAKDSADITYTARFVDTNEEFTDKLVYIGKYRQLDDNEASRFRAELEANKVDIPESAGEIAELDQGNLEQVEDKPTIEAPFQQFQSDTVQEHSVDGEVATETHAGVVEESVEERLAALEMAVFGSVKAAA